MVQGESLISPKKGLILYIGGFELPDKNAAAQRVIGIAKSLRDCGYKVCFVNALKAYNGSPTTKDYFGFHTLEYKRESDKDYLFRGKKAISIIEDYQPEIVIAYNYPALSLDRIRRHCQKNNIKCIADVTEWPKPGKKSFVFIIIKELDTAFRMQYVHKHMDSVIAISRYLYEYYKQYVPTVLIPPTVDIEDEKWNIEANKDTSVTSFVYAGSPSAVKEKLDVIVRAIEECARTNKIVLNIVGITKEQFIQMYSWNTRLPDEVIFWGRIPHNEVIRIVKRASWSVIIREDNIVVKAGFPTKLVESISCGTPVIANRFSNIADYLDNKNSLLFEHLSCIENILGSACKKDLVVDKELFDYRRYTNEIKKILPIGIWG